MTAAAAAKSGNPHSLTLFRLQLSSLNRTASDISCSTRNTLTYQLNLCACTKSHQSTQEIEKSLRNPSLLLSVAFRLPAEQLTGSGGV